MKLTYKKQPMDVIICLLMSLLLIPIILFDINQGIRIFFGLPFILFIPGYLLIYTLFPQKNKDIDIIERIALSFGLSIAVVPLIGLGLNYTPYGITLPSVLTGNLAFILIMGTFAYIRWIKTPLSQRIIYELDIGLPTQGTKLDQALTIILIMAILIAVTTLVYVIVTPRQGEQFTEFYILGPEGTLDNYPHILTIGQNAQVILGLANHEHQEKTYTIEIWLINQTITTNQTTNETTTTINHMYYQDSFTTTLNHSTVNIEENWTKQWEQNYSFKIFRKGHYVLQFLLFNGTTDQYTKHADYVELADEKFSNAYLDLNLKLIIRDW
jgi:uncharacterized membrane protein